MAKSVKTEITSLDERTELLEEERYHLMTRILYGEWDQSSAQAKPAAASSEAQAEPVEFKGDKAC